MKFFSGFGLVVLILFLTACGSDSPSVNVSSTPKVTLGNESIKSIAEAATSGDFNNPLDSAPDVNGTTIYFTATGPNGKGVFQVPASGGTATAVFTGSPFATPRCLVVSLDGQQIYVTDPGANNGGAIFAIPIKGGSPAVIRGSEGTAPQNLHVVSENGQETLYFTGKGRNGGEPAILKLSVKGTDSASVLLKGSPLVDPDGIVLTQSGVIYVSDRRAGGADSGKIFKIEGNNTKAIVEKVQTGNPAGIALSPDESVLLVSAHQPNKTNDQVLLVNLTTLETGSATHVVGENHHGAGLHRSYGNKSVFSWADSSAGPQGGKVFTVTLR